MFDWRKAVFNKIVYLFIHPTTKKTSSFRNGSLPFNLQYFGQILSNLASNDSFEISSSWGFQNCPWLLDLIKIWPRYWRLKRRLPFQNHVVFLSSGVMMILMETLLIMLRIMEASPMWRNSLFSTSSLMKNLRRGIFWSLAAIYYHTCRRYARSSCVQRTRVSWRVSQNPTSTRDCLPTPSPPPTSLIALYLFWSAVSRMSSRHVSLSMTTCFL